MKGTRIILTIQILVFSAIIAIAQPGISFDEETYDFGNIEEAGGAVEHKFVFKNKGNAPLIVQNVKASCGCTTPAWTKDPVMPGQEGFITARFNPKNRPGTFTKTLTITTNAQPNISRIYIKGQVKPQPKTPQLEYPVKIGQLRMRYRSLHMGEIMTNEPAVKKFDVYNDSEKPLTFLSESNLPEHIKIKVEPQTLSAKSKGTLTISYDAFKKNDYGTVMDNITLVTDESTESKKQLRVRATIREYFPPMTKEELAKAPKLVVKEGTYDFGSVSNGEKINTSFILTNTGQSELKIRTTKSTCGCAVAKLEKKSLQPGESTEMEVTFDSKGRKGTQQKSISIYTNDPANPTQRVIIKGRVIES